MPVCESSGQSRCFRWACEIAWKCELSTIDSTFLLAGALTAGMYFDAAASEEDEIRALADALYRRADWRWAQAGGGRCHTDGSLRPGSCRIAGQATTRRCCCTSLGSRHHRIRCPKGATRDGRSLTSGNAVMDASICTPARCSTYPDQSHNRFGWVSPWHFGINQGPIVVMIENYRSGLVWHLMRNCPYLVDGLRRAGYTGGWL